MTYANNAIHVFADPMFTPVLASVGDYGIDLN
jgi:hypothetical protein